MYTTEVFRPARFESDGSIELGGTTVSYHTVSEDNLFYDDTGKAIASVFSYSYFRSDTERPWERPVIFAFNGGPGSSSLMLHTAFLGVKRIGYPDALDEASPLPPYECVDNPQCLLDVADLVMVDPVATGYGLLLDESWGKKFFGIEEDAEAMLHFISMWLTRYGRWRSPKYLLGESYGTARAVTMAGLGGARGAEYSCDIAFDGLILIGSTVTVGKYHAREIPVEPSVTFLPTAAAIHWYHHRPSAQSVDEFVAEAKTFADTTYLCALFKGEDLRGEERTAVLERLCYYTGLSAAYLESRELRLPDKEFLTQVLGEKGLHASRYDGRITMKPTSNTPGAPLDDATMARYSAIFRAVMQDEICPLLNIRLQRTFVPSRYMRYVWNEETKALVTSEQLCNAMRRVDGMRTFIANGIYDTSAKIGVAQYTIAHARLPRERVFLKAYHGGHMVYMGNDNIQLLSDDIRCFISGGDPTK